MTTSVRLAYTDNKQVRFTERPGKHHRSGYIRVNGKTVSGFLGADNQFFAVGMNSNLVHDIITADQREQAAANAGH
jgi:hypothetical protein